MYSVDEINQNFLHLDYWEFQVEFRINNQLRHFNINSMDEIFLGEYISVKKARDQNETLHCFIDVGEEGEEFHKVGSVSLTWKPEVNECYIGTLWIEPKFRGNGLATNILNEIINLADEIGIVLTLHALPFINPENKPTEKEILKLKHYYRRFGFRENSESKGIGFDCLMEREPSGHRYQNN